MTNSQTYIKHYIILVIACLFAFFVNNQVIPADLMESRNLATAQEMVSTGNYLTPTMNGELRLEKPPLPTWIAAGIEIVTPYNLVVQRYAAGIMASIMVFFMYFLASRLTRKREIGLIAGLVLATCYNVIMMGRTATWDIYCHSFMLGAIYFIVVGFEEKGAQWGRFIIAGLLMGLSFLGKGPVSFFALLLPFLISYIIIYRPKAKGKVLSIITMVVVCIIVSAWWTTFILLFHKDMALAVADKESGSWLNHNVRPLYYYWQFPVEAGIWAIFWITSLIWFYWKKRMGENRKAYTFSIIWTLAALVLLSVIPEKKTRYLLPMLIPCAMNIAFYIYYCAKTIMSKGEKVVFRINTSIITLILFAIPIGLYIGFFKQGYISVPLLIITSLVSIVLAICMLSFTFGKKGIQVMKAFYLIVGVMIMVEALCLVPVGKIFINDDRHSIRAVRDNDKLNNLPFYHVEGEQMRMELVYEANKIIRPLDITNSNLVFKNLPFVLVSSAPADSIFGNTNVTIEEIDIFDNNWRQRESRRYNEELVRHVSIIKAN